MKNQLTLNSLFSESEIRIRNSFGPSNRHSDNIGRLRVKQTTFLYGFYNIYVGCYLFVKHDYAIQANKQATPYGCALTTNSARNRLVI